MTQRLVLVFAVVAALSAGTNYAFSSWSPQLASRLHLTSKQTNIVGASGNAGVYLSGPFLGVLVDRKGPRSALVIAAVTLFLGYTALNIMYDGGETGLFADFGVGGLAIAELLTGIGSSAGLSGAVNGVSKSFSAKKRGSAMATVVAGFGLSAFFYSTLSHTITSSDPTSSFLTLLTIGTSLSMLLGAIFVRPVLYVAPTSGYSAVADRDISPLSRTGSPSFVAEEESYFAEEVVTQDETRRREESKERAAETLDITGREMLASSDFWLMFAYVAMCSGVGLMFMNNLGTMTVTLATPDLDSSTVLKAQNHLVSTLSVCNCIGRLASGFASDHFTHRPEGVRFPRIWWFVPTASLFVLSQLLASMAGTIEGLALPTMLLGIGYGALFAVSPVVCLERFGLASFATNNGLLMLAPSISGNFANIVFGTVYDSHVDWSNGSDVAVARLVKRAGAEHAHLCRLGAACFATALRTSLCMSLGSVVFAILLCSRRSMWGSHA